MHAKHAVRFELFHVTSSSVYTGHRVCGSACFDTRRKTLAMNDASSDRQVERSCAASNQGRSKIEFA